MIFSLLWLSFLTLICSYTCIFYFGGGVSRAAPSSGCGPLLLPAFVSLLFSVIPYILLSSLTVTKYWIEVVREWLHSIYNASKISFMNGKCILFFSYLLYFTTVSAEFHLLFCHPTILFMSFFGGFQSAFAAAPQHNILPESIAILEFTPSPDH